ncbi:hypothetical protein HAX54_019188, partial [Datura stramonium]|nr:hypothetical protein [Datura stramonium]
MLAGRTGKFSKERPCIVSQPGIVHREVFMPGWAFSLGSNAYGMTHRSQKPYH